MNRSLQRLNQGLLIAFGVIALALGYWGLIRRDGLLVRPDNPRRVLDEQRIQRGQILDRDGEILAENQIDPDSGLVTRIYPHTITAPVTGYYSLRYGVDGIEAEFDELLRGDAAFTPYEIALNKVLHRPQVGGDVRLTIDLDIQQAAATSMHGRNGAIILLTVPDGEVLALLSQPGFDPQLLDENWDTLTEDPDAPLLNRVTLGQYQPGTILQSALLAEALNNNIDVSAIEWSGDPTAEIDGAPLFCNGNPPRIDSPIEAFLWACPAPFQPLADLLGQDRFNLALEDFRLREPPTFTLSTELDAEQPPLSSDLSRAVLGQGNLTVSPLQMALVTASFANHGQIPALKIIDAVRQPGTDWTTTSPPGNPLGTISPTHSDTVAAWMAQAVNEGGAKAAALSDTQVYGHAGLAIAGPDGALNGWFTGFAYLPDGTALAVVVLIENTNDINAAPRIGGEVLSAGLTAQP